jgi:hypothetical protein
MKATLEFDMNDPDDRKRHLRAVKADDMYFVIFEVLLNNRDIREEMSNHNINIDELD